VRSGPPVVYAGLTLYDARFGGRVTFEVTAADSDGALLSTTSILSAGFPRPPLHVHPHQTERFAVRRGRLRVTRGWRAHLVGPGEELEVAPGMPHTFVVEGPDEVEVRVDFVPAGDMEGFLVAMAGLARDGGLTDRGRPRLLPLAAVAQRHAGDVRLAWVPARAQDLALALLAWTRRGLARHGFRSARPGSLIRGRRRPTGDVAL
jgi:mannose-6-phosphate isomerase-like protein (cupin superfamily)